MNKIKNISVLLLILFFQQWNTLNAQNEDLISIGMQITYNNVIDYGKDITVKMLYRDDSGFHFVPELPVRFYNKSDTSDIFLGEVITNEKGISEFLISNDYPLSKDENGYFTISAVFEGNNKFETTEDQFSYKDVQLEMTLEEIDSVRTVIVKAYELDSVGNQVPVEGADLFIEVQRFFSRLVISEEYLENGKLEYEFTKLLTGDSLGNIKIIAQIHESDLYGDVEIGNQINWAKPLHVHLHEKMIRALWSPTAPVWMIITLIVLLSGVWGHYLYSIIQLVIIRRIGKKAYKDEQK